MGEFWKMRFPKSEKTEQESLPAALYVSVTPNLTPSSHLCEKVYALADRTPPPGGTHHRAQKQSPTTFFQRTQFANEEHAKDKTKFTHTQGWYSRIHTCIMHIFKKRAHSFPGLPVGTYFLLGIFCWRIFPARGHPAPASLPSFSDYGESYGDSWPPLKIPGSLLVDPLVHMYLTPPPFYIPEKSALASFCTKQGNMRGARKANSRSRYGLMCLEEAQKEVRSGASGSKWAGIPLTIQVGSGLTVAPSNAPRKNISVISATPFHHVLKGSKTLL